MSTNFLTVFHFNPSLRDWKVTWQVKNSTHLYSLTRMASKSWWRTASEPEAAFPAARAALAFDGPPVKLQAPPGAAQVHRVSFCLLNSPNYYVAPEKQRPDLQRAPLWFSTRWRSYLQFSVVWLFPQAKDSSATHAFPAARGWPGRAPALAWG